MSDYLEPMEFDSATLREVPITIGEKKYILREADGDAATAWRNAKSEAITLSSKGKPIGAKGIANSDPVLLSRCLFDCENNRIPLKEILSWPDKIQKTLVERLLQISEISASEDTFADLKSQRENLDEQIAELEESAKNETDSSEDGSA